MADIRNVRDMNGLISYFSENLGWSIDLDDFDDIEDISYDFSAEDIGLKEEAFAKIASMRQLQRGSSSNPRSVSSEDVSLDTPWIEGAGS